MTYRKKLIEVALPLEAINVASAHEKMPGIGPHPRGIHLWWARRPLVTSRAVLFGSLVDDPSSRPEEFPTEEAQEAERQRLFRIIERLVRWENSNNEAVLAEARAEIMRSTDGNPPPVLDPFAGGGSIPLEALRLGLEAHASDLNPVAVLINKALIEIPPKFAGQPPVNPESRKKIGNAGNWKGAQGLAEDVRYYGKWMHGEAEKRIGHLYPKVQLPKEYGGGETTAIAWLWARTVRCPNPACSVHMPLVRSFALSTKKGRQAWVEPVIDRYQQPAFIRFQVKTGNPTLDEAQHIQSGTSVVNEKGKKVKAAFQCVACHAGIARGEYIDEEANNGRLQIMPMAIVAEGGRTRVYLSFDESHYRAATEHTLQLLSDLSIDRLPTEPAKGTFGSNAQGRIYGFRTFSDYFTSRQLIALVTLSDLVSASRYKVIADAKLAGMEHEWVAAYADAVATYLAMGMDRLVDFNNSLTRWVQTNEKVMNVFARQAIPMVWDFAEANILGNVVGGIPSIIDYLYKCILTLPSTNKLCSAKQMDATTVMVNSSSILVSTDPPYYGNVSYADLSDFFYVWLRRSLGSIYPELFSTLLVPKSQELVATPHQFDGDKERAKEFFEEGLGKVFSRICQFMNLDYPLTVYYAFKQAEDDDSQSISRNGEGVEHAIASTGWETMLEGLMKAGFRITGTWPMRSEQSERIVAAGTNALASSIVLVCRPRPENAPVTTRREFISALRRELPDALRKLQHGNIAPVDLAQAAIGPGMAVFSRYSKVVESNGEPMRVRTALQLINQALDEVLAEQEGEYDNDTRWAIDWFTQFGTGEGQYGMAETLSKAKNTSVQGLVEAGVLQAKGGKVKLLSRDQLPENWNPTQDKRTSVWEITQHLIRALEQGGESGAAEILAQLGAEAESARNLAYRLYTLCERKNWAQEALAYNSLVVAWPSIVEQQTALPGTVGQARLDF